jgi:NfeD-like./Serine dehydrogenase proteinase.
LRERPISIILFIFAFFSWIPIFSAGGGSGKIYYADIGGSEITKGLYKYMERAVREAEKNGAEVIVFEIDTPGGLADAAADIGRLLSETEMETVAFIHSDAISAGAYIALNMDRIYMAPKSSIGAAAVIEPDGNMADEKSRSYWESKMRDAAEKGGRDPLYALAMVDPEVDLLEYRAPKGKLLTLTGTEALKVGYAEGIVKNKEELIQSLGYSQADVVEVDKTFAERLAEFITNPIVVPILLSLASLGLVLELSSPGFGFPGIFGIASLLLFFYGHFVAGLAGYESILLFAAGIILILLEFFVPGGILGILGAGSVLLSILLAGGNLKLMATNLLISILVAIITMVVLVKIFGKRLTLLNKIILSDATSTEKGYISQPDRTDLLHKTGIALTPLRPAGTIMIGGERIDAVSEGTFIPEGTPVTVIEVEGMRIVVRSDLEEQTH